ncbi:hypothetical protein LWI29_005697 [Acer saccharum]|uniref:NB-ARC domain-containing protein n=1 Tax=Acer saccharum TaxID=4024 RepID=A0AA39SUP8_ACESA|nr:hypothetical protein LWI29_005697 [Acer saccharum]
MGQVPQSHHQEVFDVDDGRLKRTGMKAHMATSKMHPFCHMALFSNSCSSSGAVKKRERQIRNKKPRMVVREDDMEMLLDFLIEGEPLLSSIAIVAQGGYGKTTLAAQVYDNIYVKNYLIAVFGLRCHHLDAF